MGTGEIRVEIIHAGLEEDFCAGADQDIDDLLDQGFLRPSPRSSSSYDLTDEGFAYARKLELSREASASEPGQAATGYVLDWHAHVLPVLEAVGRAYHRGTVDLGITPEIVNAELQRKAKKGLQVTAGWPSGSGEVALERLLALIENRIAESATDEERTRWVRLRDGITGVGRDAVAETLGALASGVIRGIG